MVQQHPPEMGSIIFSLKVDGFSDLYFSYEGGLRSYLMFANELRLHEFLNHNYAKHYKYYL